MKKKTSRTRARIKIRKKISGTPERPRLSVFRSLDNIYAQIIDDTTGKTLVAVSSLNKEAKEDVKSVKGKINKSKSSICCFGSERISESRSQFARFNK